MLTLYADSPQQWTCQGGRADGADHHDNPPCGFFFPPSRFSEDTDPIPINPDGKWAQHCVFAVVQQRYQHKLAGLFLPKHKTWTAWSKHYGVDRNRWAKNWDGLRWLDLHEIAWLNSLHKNAPPAWVDASQINWTTVKALLTSPAGKKAQAAYAGKTIPAATASRTARRKQQPARLLPPDSPITVLVQEASANLARSHSATPPNPDLVAVLTGDFPVSVHGDQDRLIVTIPDNATGTRHRKPGLILNETTLEAGRLVVERLAAERTRGGLNYTLETVTAAE